MNPVRWYLGLRRPMQVLLAILLVAAIVFAVWLAAPLFLVVSETEAAPEGSETVARGTFVGAAGHQASGDALILEVNGTYVVRTENFRVTNGPDIHVWLSPTNDVYGGAVDLGPVKSTQGSANYAVPLDSVEGYRYVLIWCNPFAVPFGEASLSFR